MESWSVQLKSEVFAERLVILEHRMVNSEDYSFSPFLHTVMSLVLTEERYSMPVCTVSDRRTINIHTNLFYAVSTRKKPRMIVATFFKIHTYFEAKKQTKKRTVNTKLCIIPMSWIIVGLEIWSFGSINFFHHSVQQNLVHQNISLLLGSDNSCTSAYPLRNLDMYLSAMGGVLEKPSFWASESSWIH